MNLDYEKTCEECLKEMFKRVGEKYPNEELTSQDKWYTLRSWTTEEENDFRDWMAKYLKKKHRWSKKQIDMEIGMFMLSWGWTNKEYIKNAIEDLEV